MPSWALPAPTAAAGGPMRREAPKKNWVLTVHKNPSNLDGFVRDNVIHNFLIVGDELGEDDVTPHWQIFGQYKSKVRMVTIKAFFGSTTHCEVIRCAAQQVTYLYSPFDSKDASEVHCSAPC
mmetsp:Transcript_5339/g.8612  ORF Transcript_5339/g.8612 Transcript_5339/m.8612 type:complete len:122 (-) Transcript_5339:833-1198(-)